MLPTDHLCGVWQNLFLRGALWSPDTQASSFSVVPLTEGRPGSFCVPYCHVPAALNTALVSVWTYTAVWLA